MQDSHELDVVQQLDTLQEELVYHVTVTLSQELPAVPLSPVDQDAQRQHQARIRQTVERFHALVQIGITVDWQLVPQEYEWASRVLGGLGVTWEHQNRLIDTYFAVAKARGSWTEQQLALLDQIAGRIQQSGQAVY